MVVILLALTCGCKKNTQVDLRPNLNAANDQVLAIRPFTYIFRMLVIAVNDSALKATHHSVIDSATVSLDAKNQQYTFLFHGKLSADSVIRTGAFTAMVDSGFYHKGSSIKFTFQGFTEDFRHVSGNDSLYCTGLVSGIYSYSNLISGAAITKDSLRTIQFSASYQVTVDPHGILQGVSQTVSTFDGSSFGTSSAGYAFSSQTMKGLSLYERCPWVCDGLISFSIPAADINSGTIAFSDKTCSDKISYDFGGNIYIQRIREKDLYY